MNRFLDIIPTILAMLRRQKFIHILLLLEVTVLTAVIINALAVVVATQDRWQTPTGIDEADIGVIRSIGVIGASNPSTAAQNLELLREIPDVESAAYGAPPLMNTSTIDVRRSADDHSASITAYFFQGSQGLAHTLGVDITQGRSFSENDPPPANSLTDASILPVLVTEGLSRHLFPDSGALGKVLYSDGNPMRVIGVVRHLRSQLTGAPSDDEGIVSEIRIEHENVGGAFTIHARKGRLDTALSRAASAMELHNPGHVQADVFTLPQKRQEYFASDMAVTRLLLVITGILLAMLACGLAALTHFLVHRRLRQIGIMRALGAMRRDIVFFFACENFFVAGGGVVLGTIMAIGVNVQLAEHYGLADLPNSLILATVAGMLLVSFSAVSFTLRRTVRRDPASLLG
jgi:putative ABC transport system permease protein